MNKKLFVSAILATLLVLSIGLIASAQGPVELLDLPGSGWWSGEQIQNVGTMTATVNAVAYDMDSASSFNGNEAYTIGQGSSITILPSVFAGAPNFVGMDGNRGSAVISSDQAMVAVVNVTNREVPSLVGVAGGYASGIYEGAGQSKIAPQLNFPSFKKNFNGKDTTHYVQNAGDGETNITATFIYGTNTEVATFNNVMSGRSVAIIPPTAIPDGTLGSLVVTNSANNDLAGVAAEYQNGVTVGQNLKASTAYVANDFDSRVFVPAFKKDYINRSSALLIQSDAAVDGVMTFTCVATDTVEPDAQCNPGQAYTATYSIAAAGGSQDAFAYDAIVDTLPEGLYGVEVTSTGGNIVVSLDETGFAGGSDFAIPAINRDTTSAGIPAKNAGRNWSCPLVKEVFASNSSAPVIYSVGAAATVDATYNNSSGSYTIQGATAASGPSLVLFDVAIDSNLTWSGGNAISQGSNNSVTISATEDVVVIVNENVHYSVSGFQQDAKQYNCFPISN